MAFSPRVALRHWSGEQLRSVLLHELAHIKRRDTMAQLLTQIACALHWFNPLVWFAAWGLRVERERACDDLVLASGVRPSAYAGHLFEVATGTGLSPARWTQACRRAMARKSSLAGRLAAVLSEIQSRRCVSVALAAIAIAFAVGIAVPVAMLRAADENLADKPTSAATDLKPRHEYAQSLFTKWQANARTDGKIPGALIGHVAGEIDRFLNHHPQDEKALKLAALRPRLDASHDWTQAGVVALLDDITAISTAPVSWADMPMEFDKARMLLPGKPLPAELTRAAWGQPAANGLRAAWLLEPRAEQYAYGSVLKARVLFHNTGKEPVVFKTETWHQVDPHTARNAKGVEIKVSGRWYTGVTLTATYRLASGEFCEVSGHGVAIGAGKYEEEFSTGSVGAVIEAKEGDDVTLSHSVDAASGGWTRPNDPKDPAELWKRVIAERVEREAPMPQAAADREQLIRRVTLDLFGEAATAKEIAAFIADNAPDALGKLTARLQARPRIELWAGKLPTGETKFRVTAADPNAAKAPRTASAPGRYVLGDNVHLLVSQLTNGEKRTNTARIAFLSPDLKVASPHKPYEIALPDGSRTYGIVWERGAGVLWVMQKGLVRKYDFTNPAQVKETRCDPGRIVDVPEQLRDSLRKVFDAPGAPVQPLESQKPKEGAKLPGRLIVNAGLRTTKNEKRFFQSAIAIDPNSGNWTRLQNLNESGFTVPLSPVRVSPDGRTMLFMRENEIWKCDAITGENPVRVFPKGQPKAWAPDGKEFIVAVEKEAGTENWRVSADGKKQSMLSLPIGEDVEDWSTDGRWLLGWSHADGQLYIMKPDGSGRRQLTNTNRNASRNEHPRFSPDDRRIVYLQTLYHGDDNGPDSRFSLRTINIDGKDNREILGETAVGPASAKATWTAPMGARWSPDGKHLAVVLFDHTRDGGIRAINGNWRLVIIDADGGNRRELKLEGVLNTVLEGDGPEWRSTAPAVVMRESKQGAKLQPGTEERLQWGQPVNGLRATLVRPAALGEPEAREIFDFKIVVQNVSDAQIHFSTTSAGPKNPFFLVREEGRPMTAFTGSQPTPVDVMLQPREVAVMRMFSERTEGQSITKDDPNLTYSAELKVENAPAGAWTGKLVTAEMIAAFAGHGLLPKHKDARALFKVWNSGARGDGKIPGALIGLLAESVTTSTKYNPTSETTTQLLKMLPRLDATRDWSGKDAVALLDELAAVKNSPIDMAVAAEYEHTIQTGAPLPSQLADAPWGAAHPSGLRLAYSLEPRAAEYRLNTPLKGRILIHNAGKGPIVFRAWTWHQCGHKATDAKGADISISSTEWETLGRLVPFRLAPGEFIEVNTAGIGVGANKDAEDWQNTRVGSWIEATAGDGVTVTTEPVPLNDWNEKPEGEPHWWLDHITARLSRHLPLPADAEARKLLLYRVAMELFGTPVSEEINAAFVADREPTALDSLAKRLAHRPGLTPYTGSLQSAPTKFGVLPADPDAAKKPRTARNPGWYTLGEHIRLDVSRRPVGERLVNKATILFFSPDPKTDASGKPVAIKLPDGYNTWAAAWVRGGTVLWVRQKSGIRNYDFSNPAQVRETTIEEPANLEKMPKPILDALSAELDVPGAQKPVTETPKPAAETPK
jgi:BlaR1 peptidase M56/Protein of unknown function (DUF1549)/WD40-like Beta Propeller Repeat